jgi:hypothetical protein
VEYQTCFYLFYEGPAAVDKLIGVNKNNRFLKGISLIPPTHEVIAGAGRKAAAFMHLAAAWIADLPLLSRIVAFERRELGELRPLHFLLNDSY